METGALPAVYWYRRKPKLGCANTAYIERFNATLRARLPSLVRRTRNLARTVKRLEMELVLVGRGLQFLHGAHDA